MEELLKKINGNLIEIKTKLDKNSFHISGGSNNIGQQNITYSTFNKPLESYQEKIQTTSFEEVIGKGIFTTFEEGSIKLGSSQFLEHMSENTHKKTKVHVEVNGVYKGSYVFNNQYRKGLEQLFAELSKKYQLVILSGDNDGERKILEKMLSSNTVLVFNQKPEQKLQYIEQLQQNSQNVMMVGDGLNDAGALAQSNVGIVISENVNVFSPACDGIVDASRFESIGFLMNYAKNVTCNTYIIGSQADKTLSANLQYKVKQHFSKAEIMIFKDIVHGDYLRDSQVINYINGVLV